jgi:hypothetical protein
LCVIISIISCTFEFSKMLAITGNELKECRLIHVGRP